MALMCSADRNIQEAVHLFKRISNGRESQRLRHDMQTHYIPKIDSPPSPNLACQPKARQRRGLCSTRLTVRIACAFPIPHRIFSLSQRA